VERVDDAFFSLVLDAAPDGMLILDEAGTISFANQKATELFGIEHDRLVGSSVDDLLPDHLRSAHRAHRLRYRAEPAARPMGIGLRLQARRGDGTVFPVEISLSPLDVGGDFQVVAAIRDVTARIEAEEDMRRVLLTLDATEDAVFIMDPDSLRIGYVNEGASRQVGYSSDQLVGMTLSHLNPDLSPERLRSIVDDLQVGASAAVGLRTVHRTRDGTDIPVEVNLQAVADEDGGRPRIIAVARDISARLEAEAQVQRSQQALQEADRVMAIADDRQRIARDLHDTVIQRLFASGLTLQALMTRAEPEIGSRLETVVDDLDQTISEIRTAIFSLQDSSMGDETVRSRCLRVVRESADSLGFTPGLEFAGAVDTMDDAVAEQLVPTLREALSNVAKHARSTAVTVVVGQSGETTTLTVIDDGLGIDSSANGGHGLPNMRARAEQLGGRLVVERTEPSGTSLMWTATRNATSA
jgi:PAS domain S-box-containing protein